MRAGQGLSGLVLFRQVMLCRYLRRRIVTKSMQPVLRRTGYGYGYGPGVIGDGGRRSWRPFVGPLTHSRKLYSSKEPGPEPMTPLEQSLQFPRPSNLPSSTLRTLCPTTANATPLLLQTYRPRTNPGSRTPLFSSSTSASTSNSRIRPYSRPPPAAFSSAPPLPIMYEGKWTALTVRKTFLDYFAERGHTIGTMPDRHSHDFNLSYATHVKKSWALTAPPRSALLLCRPSQ